MGMAMFKRTFARTIPDNLRAPHMKMWGFEAKRARKFTRTSPRTLPWNFITMLSAPLINNGFFQTGFLYFGFGGVGEGLGKCWGVGWGGVGEGLGRAKFSIL